MPITPFHVGPGLALHSAAPRAVSFIAFCVANVLVDSVMHADMAPFAPLSSSAPLWLLVSLEALHLFCLVSGLLGLAMLGLRWFVGRRRAAPDT